MDITVISSKKNWPKISDHIAGLMQQCAELGLELVTNPLVLDQLENANKNNIDHVSAQDDPVLIAQNRRSTRAIIIHWLSEVIDNPKNPVTPFALSEFVNKTVDLYGEEAAHLMHINARSTQDIAWQYWMKVAFQVSQDPLDLQQLLEVSSVSINTFSDACLAMSLEQLQQALQYRRNNRLENQKELIARIIDGDNVDLNEALRVLDYPLQTSHHSAIIWSEEIDTEISALEDVASALRKASQQQQQLKILSSNSVIWLWVPATQAMNSKVLESTLKQHRGIRVSYGTAGKGLDGFRRAHLDAVSAQRVLSRLKSNIQLVSFDRVRLMAFLSKDAISIQHYSEHVLGELAHAPATVRQSLHAFLECGCNATEAAKKLHTHRNTLLRRLAKAEEMLPRPLAENRIQIAVALEALYWIL